jgi:hypothetical protein
MVPASLAGHTNDASYRRLVRVDDQNCSSELIFGGPETTREPEAIPPQPTRPSSRAHRTPGTTASVEIENERVSLSNFDQTPCDEDLSVTCCP